jgi:hypothetical protein
MSNAQTDSIEVCRECGDTFVLTPNQIHWFLRRNMRPPKRCQECRAIARAERETAHGRQACPARSSASPVTLPEAGFMSLISSNPLTAGQVRVNHGPQKDHNKG